MIEILTGSEGNILGVKASGQLTDEDYEKVLIPRLEEVIFRDRRVRVIFVVAEDFEGFGVKAILEDVKFGLVEGGFHLEKLALVGGPEWFRWGVRISAHFIHGEVKFFSTAQLPQAWEWIRQPGQPETKRDHSYPA